MTSTGPTSPNKNNSNSAATTNNSGVGTSSSPLHFLTFSATGTQLLYDFGQTSGRYGAARRTLEAQRFNETTARMQVLLNVRRAYFGARANRELVDVARETLEGQQIHLQQVQGFVSVGTQPQIALAQQKAAVANAQVQLITAQNNYDTARAQLNQAAGIPGGTASAKRSRTRSARRAASTARPSRRSARSARRARSTAPTRGSGSSGRSASARPGPSSRAA
jgi:outer membrane protein